MRKTLNKSKLAERSAKRVLMALTLSASFAAFGCTTNRNPGNGEPMTGGPVGGSSAPTSGATSGTSTGGNNIPGPLPGPMTSSYRGADVSEAPLTRADRAAAIMAELQQRHGRVLGPVNPGSASRSYASTSVTTGAVGYVSSSISSAPAEAISAAPAVPAIVAVPVTPASAAMPMSSVRVMRDNGRVVVTNSNNQ